MHHGGLITRSFNHDEKKFHSIDICGLYYKHVMIVNDNSTIVNKSKDSLTGDARVVIYNCHVFIVQATGRYHSWKFGCIVNKQYFKFVFK
jgi:hypothetical protein